jgi:CBS domain-containing protein
VEILGKAKRVRIYLNEDDRVHGRPAHLFLLEFLRRENAQGASVIRASEGFGASGRIHVAHLVDVAPRLPVIVEWIDRAEQVERLVPAVKAMLPHGLITMDDTEVLLAEPRPVRDLPETATVADVMSRDVASVAPRTPIRDVVQLVLGKVYRGLPVVADGRPVGMITSGDLVQRGGLGVRLDLLARLDAPEVHALLARLAEQDKVAADVMTAGPVTVRERDTLPEVAEAMVRRRLKRVPVVDAQGKLVGMVSRVDLLRTAAGGFADARTVAREIGLSGDVPLSRVMRRDVPMVHPDTGLPEVFQAVVSTRLNRALVVDVDKRVLGIVTDAELLERVAPAHRQGALRSLVHRLPFVHAGPEDARSRARTAAEVMSAAVATAREDALVSHGIAVMLNGGHKVLAVTDGEGRLTGIVDRADLLHGLVPR